MAKLRTQAAPRVDPNTLRRHYPCCDSRQTLHIPLIRLVILIILILSFQLYPYEADGEFLGTEAFLTGFGHEALITMCAPMIMGKGMEVAGAVRTRGHFRRQHELRYALRLQNQFPADVCRPL